jgi:hypothetical protein
MTHMNLIDIASYVTTEFVLTFTSELAWSLGRKGYLSMESNSCKIMGTIDNRSILESY